MNREARPIPVVEAAPRRKVAAWDGPTRLFKWLLVAAIVVGYLTYRSDDTIKLHIWNGYFALILVVFRVIWGFVGSSTARFGTWVAWPWHALSHGLELLRGRSRRYLGHNPLGGWMVIALLIFVAAQAISGLFTVDSNGIFGGPFANLDFGDPTPAQKALSRWHRLGFYIFLGLVAVHVSVNVFYEAVKKDPLIQAMVTGSKPSADYTDAPELVPASYLWLRAGLCFLVAAMLVFGTVKGFGGKLPF